MNLRQGTSRDLEFLSNVCRDADILYKDIMPGAFEKQAKKFMSNGLPKEYSIYVIEEQGQDIGFIGIKQLSNEVQYLVGLYILSKYQRKGLGNQIIDKLISDYKGDYEQIILLAHKDAYWAENFYLRNGFTQIAENKEQAVYQYKFMEQLYIENTLMMRYELNIPKECCPICGNKLKDQFSIGEICPCCGNESEFDDDITSIEFEKFSPEEYQFANVTLEELRIYDLLPKKIAYSLLRAQWILGGCQWKYNNHNEKPIDWNNQMAKEQLLNIDYNY